MITSKSSINSSAESQLQTTPQTITVLLKGTSFPPSLLFIDRYPSSSVSHLYPADYLSSDIPFRTCLQPLLSTTIPHRPGTIPSMGSVSRKRLPKTCIRVFPRQQKLSGKPGKSKILKNWAQKLPQGKAKKNTNLLLVPLSRRATKIKQLQT